MSYFGGFNNKKDVCNMFQVPKEEQDINIIFAAFDEGDVDGYATVIFEKHGKLYEVNGENSSLYPNDMSGQWKPKEVSIESLKNRIKFNCFCVGIRNSSKEMEEAILKFNL